MSAHPALLDTWQARLAAGTHNDCMSSSALRPGSFCVVFDMCWGGPGSCMTSLLAPEYFDAPGDFVAFLRVVELPRSLAMMVRDDDASRACAEDYLAVVDAETLPLLEAVLAAADHALARPQTSAADAERVIAAYNALFGRRRDARFIAAGDVTAVLTEERVTEGFAAWSDDPDDLPDEDDKEMIVKRLLDAGEFDAGDAGHVAMARALLAEFPAC